MGHCHTDAEPIHAADAAKDEAAIKEVAAAFRDAMNVQARIFL